MKVLQINIRVNVGSTSRITEQIGLKVLEQGWKSYIAYGRPSNPSKSRLIRIGNYMVVCFHYILSMLTDSEGLHSSQATKELVNEIIRIKPDIIHLHNIHGHYLNYRELFHYLNTTSIPVVWTFHDCWPFTGHCAHFISGNCYKWETQCFKCPLKRSYPKSLFCDRSSNNYKLKKNLFIANENLHVVTVSQWLANMARTSFFGNKDIRVINNGIDLSVFKPGECYECSETDSLSGKFVIMAASTAWSEEKGLQYYKRLSSKLKDDEVILLVGIGKERQRTMPTNIICIDKTKTQCDLVNLYRRSNIVASLSKAETFGLTIVEAMACGTPVIVNDNTAQPELINKSVGLVVNAENTNQVYDAIQHIRSKGKSFYANNCIKHAQKYNMETKFQEYIDLYKELCR